MNHSHCKRRYDNTLLTHSNVIMLCPQLWRAARAWCTSRRPLLVYRRVSGQTRPRNAACRGPRAVCVPKTLTSLSTTSACRLNLAAASTTMVVITRWTGHSCRVWLGKFLFSLLSLLLILLAVNRVLLPVHVLLFIVLLLEFEYFARIQPCSSAWSFSSCFSSFLFFVFSFCVLLLLFLRLLLLFLFDHLACFLSFHNEHQQSFS